MVKAKTKKEFIEAWNEYVEGLYRLMPSQEQHYKRLKQIINDLKELVKNIAQTKKFKEVV